MKDGTKKEMVKRFLSWLKKYWWIAVVLLLTFGLSFSGFKISSPWLSCEKTSIDLKKADK